MSSQKEPSVESSLAIEYGRVSLCDGLVISVNRSWQVDVEPGSRPNAPFKAAAPVAAWSAMKNNIEEQGDVYLAAVAPHDAFWIGFEADEDSFFAITIDLDGRNALTGRQGRTDTLERDPRNFLLAPDQPWFDSIFGHEGMFEQLIPHFDTEIDQAEFSSGGEIHLVIYPIDANELEQTLVEPSEDPEPMYSQEDIASSQARSTVHLWQGRNLRSDFQTPLPCARLTFHIVEPTIFESLIGIHLPEDMFDDAGESPPIPFDPFQ